MPFHVKHVIPSAHVEEMTAWYDNALHLHSEHGSEHVAFKNVVISDIQGSATSNELCAAAFHHVKTKGKGYTQVMRRCVILLFFLMALVDLTTQIEQIGPPHTTSS